MSGPKHLWSGDWKRESAATSGAEADRHQDPRTPDQTPETSAGTERRNGRIAVAATLAVLVIAVVAIVATSGASNSPQPTSAASIPGTPTGTSQTTPTPTSPGQTSPGQTAPNLTIPNLTNPNPTNPNPTNPNPTTPAPATPQPPTSTSSTTTTPTVAPQPVSWLGMEILTIPSGAAVIDAVTPGGAGDRAGLTPGDTIVAVDGHPVTGSASIAHTLSAKHKGEMVTVTVVRGGTTINVQVPFTGPPTGYP